MTLYQIPHLALGGELTKDQHQRSQLFSANTVFNFVTLATFAFVAWGYFFAGERVRESDGEVVPGHLYAASYGPLVMTAGVGTGQRLATVEDDRPYLWGITCRLISRFLEVMGRPL